MNAEIVQFKKKRPAIPLTLVVYRGGEIVFRCSLNEYEPKIFVPEDAREDLFDLLGIAIEEAGT